MSPSREERLLAFLEGELDRDERERVLDELAADPSLAEELRFAAAGLDAVRDLRPRGVEGVGEGAKHERRPTPARIGAWIAAAVAATLVVAVPATWWLARGPSPEDGARRPLPVVTDGLPQADPSFVLVLHGRWTDAAELDAAEVARRRGEYWSWTGSLAERGLLVGAGDLRWEPGERLGPNGVPVMVDASAVETSDFMVGMFVLDVGSYQEARAIARDCPHLRYGGSVSVRQVGSGFVTTSARGPATAPR